MTIYFFKGLTRNPEIGNNPVWVLSSIWRLVPVKFGRSFSNKMLLNAKNDRVTSFTIYELRENQQGEPGKITI